jgi:hypothetical protein
MLQVPKAGPEAPSFFNWSEPALPENRRSSIGTNDAKKKTIHAYKDDCCSKDKAVVFFGKISFRPLLSYPADVHRACRCEKNERNHKMFAVCD